MSIEKGFAMQIEVRQATRPDRGLIRRMMELYLHDFSEFEDEDLDEHGLYGYGDLDYFWFEEGFFAFVVTVDGKLAGFVLVNNEVYLPDNERSISEFFIVRKYRRRSIGRHVAFEVFNSLPGKWEVAELENSYPSQEFWRKVIAEYTQGAFSETVLDNDEWKGPVQSFDNRG
jgi:predicted acetyltransferase